jgi:hypothetical protein
MPFGMLKKICPVIVPPASGSQMLPPVIALIAASSWVLSCLFGAIPAATTTFRISSWIIFSHQASTTVAATPVTSLPSE